MTDEEKRACLDGLVKVFIARCNVEASRHADIIRAFEDAYIAQGDVYKNAATWVREYAPDDVEGGVADLIKTLRDQTTVPGMSNDEIVRKDGWVEIVVGLGVRSVEEGEAGPRTHKELDQSVHKRIVEIAEIARRFGSDYGLHSSSAAPKDNDEDNASEETHCGSGDEEDSALCVAGRNSGTE